MKKRCLLLLSALMIFWSCAVMAEDSIAVRVGNRTFTRSQVQKYITQTAMSLELASGESMAAMYTPDEQADFIQLAAEHFVTLGVLREKLAENGLETISAEEESQLNEFARSWYEEVWQNLSERLAQAYPDEEIPESFVTRVMIETGYSMDDIYEIGLMQIQEKRLIDLYCGDIQVTGEEARAYYNENNVEKDKEKYGNDLTQFEVDVLLNGGSSCYTPDGFYYIRFMMLQPNSDRTRQIEVAQYAVEDAEKLLEDANAQLTAAALDDGKDLEDARQAYKNAQDEADRARATLDQTRKAAAEDYAPLMKIVRAALKDGADFGTVISMYGTEGNDAAMGENGQPFHPQSVIWDPDFVAEVSKLQEPGDLIGPFFAGNGIYIVERGADIPGGAYEPEAEEMEQIRDELLYERQVVRLNELSDQWRAEMDVSVDLTGLEFPKY